MSSPSQTRAYATMWGIPAYDVTGDIQKGQILANAPGLLHFLTVHDSNEFTEILFSSFHIPYHTLQIKLLYPPLTP